MRKRPNLAPRMEKCGRVLINEPESLKGHWRESFGERETLWLEIGCGKGSFTAALAKENPAVQLLAIEKVADAMIKGMELVCDSGIENVRFIEGDALTLRDIFAPCEVERIYINFCDPWPKSRDAKHRLTAPAFLRSYADLLPLGGEIRFKTDNLPLFEWSLQCFTDEGWQLECVTNDLHRDGIADIMTDYETKFHSMGLPINRLVAIKTESTKCGADGVPARLRDAALSDAKGSAK